MKAILEMRSAH